MSDRKLVWRVAIYTAVVVIVGGGLFVIMLPSHCHPAWTNYERGAVAALRVYSSAQETFARSSRYGNAKGRVYANPRDGKGLADLGAAGIIEEAFALATSPERAKGGYYFVHVTRDSKGPYDYSKQHGLCAVPARHGKSGFATFIVDTACVIYRKDNGGKPVTTWPDVKKEGWEPVE